VAWLAVYWATYVLTWVALPLHQGYEAAGAFSWRGRVRESVRSNLRFYALLVSLIAAGVVWMLFTGALSGGNGGLSLHGLAIALPNAFGLAVSILLLAYGLIETPRGLWNGADFPRRLRELLSRLAGADDKARECEGELARCLGVAAYADGQIPDRAPHRPAMDVVMRMAAAAGADARGGVGPDPITVRDLSSDELDYDLDEASLEPLHTRLRLATCAYQRARAKHAALVSEARLLDDVVKAKAQGTGVMRCAERTVQRWESVGLEGGGETTEGLSSGRGTGAPAVPTAAASDLSLRDRALFALARSPAGLPAAAVLWAWRLHAAPVCSRAAAFALGCASFCVIVAEATLWFGRSPDLSAYSHVVHSRCPCGDVLNLDYGPDGGIVSSSAACSGQAVQLAVVLPLAYVVYCAYSSLFRLSFFDYYALTPGYSDGYSLLVSSGLLCRFIVPLVFNFLSQLHVDDMAAGVGGAAHEGVPTTAFAKIMVPMDMVPLLGDFINVYYPATLVLFCVIVQYDWTGKAARLVGYGSSLFSSSDEFLAAEDEVNRGRAVLENFRSRATDRVGVSYRGHAPVGMPAAEISMSVDERGRPGETVAERIQRYRDRKERRIAAKAAASTSGEEEASLSFTDRLRGFMGGGANRTGTGGGAPAQEFGSTAPQARVAATEGRAPVGSAAGAKSTTLDSIFARVDRSRRADRARPLDEDEDGGGGWESKDDDFEDF